MIFLLTDMALHNTYVFMTCVVMGMIALGAGLTSDWGK